MYNIIDFGAKLDGVTNCDIRKIIISVIKIQHVVFIFDMSKTYLFQM